MWAKSAQDLDARLTQSCHFYHSLKLFNTSGAALRITAQLITMSLNYIISILSVVLTWISHKSLPLVEDRSRTSKAFLLKKLYVRFCSNYEKATADKDCWGPLPACYDGWKRSQRRNFQSVSIKLGG